MYLVFSSIITGVAVLAPPVWVQSQVISPLTHGTTRFPGPTGIHARPVTGAPYSAEQVQEQVTVGPDGTRFTGYNWRETIYRDSAGRIRDERTARSGMITPSGAPLIVQIQDPVGNVTYVLDTQAKVAHRVAWLPAPSRAPVASSPAPDHPRPESTTEDLGQREIGGVMAQGYRYVLRWQAGYEGSDRPFQTVREQWNSPELHEVVLEKLSDPRTGESSLKLTHISRAEQPASLFLPPPDYTVVDETRPFQIEWTAGKP